MTTIMRLLLPAGIATVLTLLSAFSVVRAAEVAAGTLAVTSPWARATPPGATVGAAYATLENRGDEDDRLLRVASPVARAVELHETLEENGMAKMRPLGEVVVPAGGKLEMRPGSTHMMLMGLTAPLKAGDTVPLTLTFNMAGAVTVDFVIAPIGAGAPAEVHRAH